MTEENEIDLSIDQMGDAQLAFDLLLKRIAYTIGAIGLLDCAYLVFGRFFGL